MQRPLRGEGEGKQVCRFLSSLNDMHVLYIQYLNMIGEVGYACRRRKSAGVKYLAAGFTQPDKCHSYIMASSVGHHGYISGSQTSISPKINTY